MKKFVRLGNWFLFVGLTIFMIIFTIVSVMGNIESQKIDGPAGIVFIIGSILILIGLIF